MIKELIKTQIRTRPFLYQIYFHLLRKHVGDKVILPHVSHDFYFDGFPRSGNTYFAELLKYSSPELKFSHHLHTIAGIKLAFKLKLTVFIIVREPAEAISSYFVMKKNRNINLSSLINNYCSYYEFLLRNKTKIQFIFFPQWLENKETTIINLTKLLNLETNKISEELVLEFDKLMKQIEKNKRNTAGSFPNKEKTEFKNKVKAEMLSLSSFNHAQHLFLKLKQEEYSKSVNADSRFE